jgi:hypothetical protein
MAHRLAQHRSFGLGPPLAGPVGALHGRIYTDTAPLASTLQQQMRHPPAVRPAAAAGWASGPLGSQDLATLHAAGWFGLLRMLKCCGMQRRTS